jgi:hypothetical protein
MTPAAVQAMIFIIKTDETAAADDGPPVAGPFNPAEGPMRPPAIDDVMLFEFREHRLPETRPRQDGVAGARGSSLLTGRCLAV